MFYQNITSGFACLYFWKCVWSEAACFTVAQRKQICASLWETEQPSLLFRKTKWTRSSKVRRTAVALVPCSKSEVPLIFHEVANMQSFKCWASSEEIWVHEVCLHICWVVVQKSGCSQESIHLFHRRNWGNKELHGKELESEQVFKIFYGEIKHKEKKNLWP